MNDPVILFVKPKAISNESKVALLDAGVVVVEIESPAEVKLVRAGAEISSSDMLGAVAQAIAGSSHEGVRILFANAICAAIIKATGAA